MGREIIVTPFSASLIGLDPTRSRMKKTTDDCRYDVISSDILIRNGKYHYMNRLNTMYHDDV